MAKSKKLTKKQKQALKELKDKIAVLPQFVGKQITHFELRDIDDELNTFIGETNELLKGSGKELHAIGTTIDCDKEIWCASLNDYVARRQCPGNPCYGQ